MGVYICPVCDVLWADTRLAKGIKGTSERRRCSDCSIGEPKVTRSKGPANKPRVTKSK